MGVLEVVGEAVVVWALVVVEVLVVVLTVGVTSELGAELGAGAVTVEDWVVWADVLEVGLTTLVGFAGDTGLTGLVTLVGFVTDFTQLLDVVTQGCHTGCPYGFGHVEERVWIMLPV